METDLQGYWVVGSNVFAEERSIPHLAHADSLVLDIDGIILDVTGSFRVAISRTVQFYLKEILGFEGDRTALIADKTQLFKLAGGFNNDWELTYAAVLFYLMKAERVGTRDIDELKKTGPNVKNFTGQVREAGGGLKAAEEVAFDKLKPEAKAKVFEEWDRIRIKQIFQEFYAGEDWCERLYGFKPAYIHEPGLINEEKMLLDVDKISAYEPRLGIVTGRTKEETDAALEIAGLKGHIQPEAVAYDDGGAVVKPQAELLWKIEEVLDTKLGIYLGDTPDDLRFVQNSRSRPVVPGLKTGKEETQPRWASAIVARNLEEANVYFDEKADLVGVGVGDVLDALKNLREAKHVYPFSESQ